MKINAERYYKIKIIFKTIIIIWSIMLICHIIGSCHKINHYIEEDIGNRAIVLAVDISNRTKISREDYSYLKSITFKELLDSEINKKFEEDGRRLMAVSDYRYIYLLCRLEEGEKKYGKELIYLLDAVESVEARKKVANGKNYYDDEIRYDVSDELFDIIDKSKVPSYTVTKDKRGEYIQAYAPFYTIEGDYIGLIGVDILTTKYKQIKVKYFKIMISFVLTNLIIAIIAFTLFKYIQKAYSELEDQRYLLGIDELTRLLNRRRFNEIFIEEWQKAQKSKLTLTLMLVDLDYFKEYNDNYGHSAGDMLLKTIGEALNKEVSKWGGYVGRFGGDEFQVLLPNIDIIQGEKIGNDILNAVKDLNIEHLYSPSSNIQSVSIGVVSIIPNNKINRHEFFNYADSALYLSKRYGRNRVSIWKI